MLAKQLFTGSAMIVATVLLHIVGLVYLSKLLTKLGHTTTRLPTSRTVFVLLSVAVFFVIGLHSLEAWIWEAFYIYVGEFADLAPALYFSVVTATTLGYGDITLSESTRLLAGFEAMGGLILFGASTAFLIAVMRRLFEDGPRSPRRHEGQNPGLATRD